MPKQVSRADKIRDAFLVLGSQYFAHARYSSQIFYLPVSATLFHHSIEMLLKGYLSKTMSSSDLKRIGHDLVDLWNQFKLQVDDERLSRFDHTIGQLAKVELLRYPDAIVDEGYVLHVSLNKPNLPVTFPGMEELPQYYIDVSDLDSIAAEVYNACEVSPEPYFKGAPMEFLNALPSSLFRRTADA
jgi:hypothetical protein